MTRRGAGASACYLSAFPRYRRFLSLLANLAAQPLWARYAGYAGRFATALAKLQGGELEYLTRPIIDSYHTIWFELHEDLITGLGIDRSQEGSF